LSLTNGSNWLTEVILSSLLSSSDSFSIPSSGMESICRTDGPLPCGLKLEPGREFGSAVQLIAMCPGMRNRDRGYCRYDVCVLPE